MMTKINEQKTIDWEVLDFSFIILINLDVTRNRK